MGEIAPQDLHGTGPGPCPPGLRGREGWSSTDEVAVEWTDIHNLHWEGNERVESRTEEMLYVDRTHREVGIRTKDGGRVFISLDVLLELLKRGVL